MLHALIDNIPEFMYVKDIDSRFVVANPHLAHAVGVKSTEELLGKTDHDFYPPELANAFYEDEQNVIRTGKPLYNREEKGVDSEGNQIDILTTKVPIRDSEGQVIGIAGVGRDISARKEIEMRFERQNETIVESSTMRSSVCFKALRMAASSALTQLWPVHSVTIPLKRWLPAPLIFIISAMSTPNAAANSNSSCIRWVRCATSMARLSAMIKAGFGSR